MWKTLCQNPWCGPHGNPGSVIELYSNYPGERILTYRQSERRVHNSSWMGLLIVLCYWNMMAPFLSCHNDNWCAYCLALCLQGMVASCANIPPGIGAALCHASFTSENVLANSEAIWGAKLSPSWTTSTGTSIKQWGALGALAYSCISSELQTFSPDRPDSVARVLTFPSL